jgi:23S rRNA pseudouridine1911/1915/1917 synthase
VSPADGGPGDAIEEEIPAALDGERLDRVVSLLTGFSRSASAALVANGGVAVDGVTVSVGKQRVAAGQVVSVTGGPPDTPLPGADASVRFAVVHEDADVIVVDKPAGLVVHPGAGQPAGTLVNGLLARYPEIADVGEAHRPGIVHRLDRDTSGLMVVARSAAGYEGLVSALSAREVTRRYLALVWGVPDSSHGIIDAPIGRSTRMPTRMAVVSTGRDARTHYEVVAAYHEPVSCSLLRCQLETGRTHQIRVHLAAIGHPVVGDRDYGGVRVGLDPPRMVLHAEHLEFVHPVTGEPLAFDAPVPHDLGATLAALRA